jgi:hypothetical protein
MYLATTVQKKMDQEEVARWRDLAPQTRKAILQRFDTSPRFIFKCLDKKALYQAFVTSQRLGLNGVRPFGSRGSVQRQGQGARIRTADSNPGLSRVFAAVRTWFEKERRHGHEIKNWHIRTRFLLQLETEIGRQTVLHQMGSDKYSEKVLEACRTRLAKFNDAQYVHKCANQWERIQLFPRIGAHARRGQKLSHQSRKFEPLLARLTWASIDYLLYQTLHGSHLVLSQVVADPEAFQDQAAQLPAVASAPRFWGPESMVAGSRLSCSTVAV